jgi:hypothetical protein
MIQEERTRMSQEKIDYINTLELSDISEPGGAYLRQLLASEDSPRAGFVCGGSLVSFVAGVSRQSQHDALNSTLLAQLAANRKYDREADTVNWYKFYRDVLENVGWVVQGFDFTKLHASGSSFTVDKVVLDIIASLATGGADLAAVEATLKAAKALKGSDGRLVLFEQSSHSLKQGNFQIGLATEYGGALALGIAAMYFSTQQNVTSILWFSFSNSETDLYKGGQRMTLNLDVYRQVRQAIIDKLGDKAERFVKDLDIG